MPKYVKKFISLMLFCALCIGNGIPAVGNRTYAAESENVAVAVLTDSFQAHNFAKVRMGENEKVNYITREGTRSWFMDNTSKQEGSFMYFDLSDKFAFEINDGTVFDIEFEYYSQDAGWFGIIYDSQRKAEKNGEFIYVGNSKSWETATITIDDAYFGNRVLGAYDFILTIQALDNNMQFSPGDIAIRKVSVTKHTAKNPITNWCYIEEAGNIFTQYQESNIIYNNLKNTTDKEMTVELKSSAVTTSGEVKWEGSQSVTLAPYEEKAVPVDVKTDWCDLYDYRSSIIGDGFKSDFKPYRFAIVKTDPNGVKNERYYINIHPERWHDTVPEMAEVLKKLNCEGVRFTYGWRFVEWNKAAGKIAYGDNHKNSHRALTDAGIKFLICLNQASGGYCDDTILPETEEVDNRYKEAITFIVNNAPEDAIFEMWNEPMANFMRTGNLIPSPDNFARVSAMTVDLIHELRPEAEVGVWSLCGMVQDQVFEKYYLPGMESEYKIWENADALAMHPYTRMPMERSTMKDDTVMKYLNEFYKRGRDDIEVWNTEIGFTPIDKDIATEENKAAYNSRLFVYLTGEDLNDIYAHYNFEQKGVIETGRETNFGIVTCGDASTADTYGKNYVATESYVSATALNYIMAQVTPNGNYTKDNVMAYRFKSDKFGCDLVSMWGIDYDEVRKVDLGTNSITYFDVNGNETILTSEDGTYTFDITHQPFYLIGDISKVEILDTPDFELSGKEYNVLPGDIMAVAVNKNIEGSYTIDVETPEYLSLRESTGFVGNQAVLSFDILSEFKDNAYILLNIKDKSGKLVQKLEVRCVMAERAVSSDITSSIAGYDNLNRWKTRITVTNESNTHLKRGYIKFNSPSAFATLKTVDLGPIPPQMTAEVEINCPEIVEKGMYAINYDVVLDDGKSYNFSKAVDFTVSPKMNEAHPIVIDGVIENDEWDKSTAMYLNTIEQVTGYEDWGGKDDLSGYYIVSWDEENFYLCANVTDDVFSQEPESVKTLASGDSITFAVYDDIEVYIVSGQGNVDYHGVDVALTNDGPKAYRNKAQTFNAIAVGEMTEQVEMAIKRDGNKTYYEYKCPWETLLGYEYTPQVGGEISFAATLNENDGEGKRGYMQFSSGLGATKNVELFAKLRFIDANK